MKSFLKRCERSLRDQIARLLGVFARPALTTPQEIRKAFEEGRIKKVLLVRTYQGLGDLLCTTPVISNLKATYPDVSIHFLANTFNQAALEGNPKVDRVWAWNERTAANPLGWIRLLRGLRKEKFDLALILSGNALSLTAILLACFSGSRWKTGYETQGYGKTWGKFLYSCELPYAAPLREIDKFLGLLTALGLPTGRQAPEYFVTPTNQDYVRTYLDENFSGNPKPLVGIFLGGKVDRPERIWPAEFYARTARELVRETGCHLIVIAPPRAEHTRHKRESSFWMDEEIHERQFREAYGDACPVFRESHLGRVAALFQRLDLLICPDGGMMHLAAAVGAPTLALFFGTNPDVWHPPVASSHYLKVSAGLGPQSLLPEEVIREAKRLLHFGIKTV